METTGKNSGTLCHERHVGDEDERDGEERERGEGGGTERERRGETRHGEDERERRRAYENDVCVTAVDIDAPSGH